LTDDEAEAPLNDEPATTGEAAGTPPGDPRT